MRNFASVVDRILAEIPEDHDVLRVTIEAIKRSAIYAAPEALLMQWTRLGKALTDYLGPFQPSEPWTQKISAIIRGAE
jgi:hypothetical protein